MWVEREVQRQMYACTLQLTRHTIILNVAKSVVVLGNKVYHVNVYGGFLNQTTKLTHSETLIKLMLTYTK